MEELKIHHKQQAFEHELINRRLTWLLSSQSILFASVAFIKGFIQEKGSATDDDSMFLNIVSSLGIAISVLIWIGVVMGIFAKFHNWKDYQRAHDKKKYWGERTWITVIALLPDVFMPVAFAVAWWLIR